MATISRRGNLQWQAKVRRQGHKQISKTFETRKDAEAWARMIERDMDKGEYMDRDASEKVTLEEALDKYAEEYVPALAYPENELFRIGSIKRRDICALYLKKVRIKDLADYIKDRESEGAKPNTIRLELAILSRVFEVARSDLGMESLGNPVKQVRKPKTSQGRTRRLEKGEEGKLLDVAGLKLTPVIRFALETAMRRTEISSMTWDKVDLKRRSVFLPETKNRESRTVPLSPAAQDILKELPGDNVTPISGQVFGMSPGAISQAMRKAVKKAGLEDLKFHDLRHEATSRFFENTDLDVMEIKSITGHKSMQMLARYSHLRTDRLADRLAGGKRGG